MSKFSRIILTSLFTIILSSWAFSQETSMFIIVDQFGYRPVSQKIAFVKNPKIGFDSEMSFNPGTSYAVVNVANGEKVFEGSLTSWNNGNMDNSSGDQVWWFDFSSFETSGEYYVLDVEKNLRSFEFQIDENIYEELLKQAMRTFYYQRVGYAKKAPYADERWEDDASHLGPQQDGNARFYLNPSDASLERDVRGGWYDAGDYNKYTNWTAGYIIEMCKTYVENPDAFGDDYNIPESGNGRPDILDEVKWGLDHLLRLQNEDGSMISIVGLSGASPPSEATGPSIYGAVNTSAAFSSAAAFAIGAIIFERIGNDVYAEKLQNAAINAWDWAEANPNVIWRNNDSSYASKGVGAGQQEVDDYGRYVKKLLASLYLYQLTGENNYKSYFEANYRRLHLFEWNYAYPFETGNQEIVLQALKVDGISESIKNDIVTVYSKGMDAGINWPAFDNATDPFMAYLKDYTWGSNGIKGRKGSMYYDVITYGTDNSRIEDARVAAEQFLHYIHGANPLNFVYLSNMYEYGAENGVNEFYHTWFHNGSALWDRVGESTYGPAPGFVVGGANPSYNWDGCCPSGCGSAGNNSKCTAENISPPLDQPDQKSYKDFNTSWPLNSWSISENSCGYQISYIRLLSKYVSGKFIDCSTGACVTNTVDNVKDELKFKIYPIPSSGYLNISGVEQIKQWKLMNFSGQLIKTGIESFIELDGIAGGFYLLSVNGEVQKLIVQ